MTNVTKEWNIETDRKHVFELTYSLVEVRIEWPSHLVDRLPDDFQLILSGSGIPTQQLGKEDASSDGDLVCFDFQWEDKKKSVQLEASGNGNRVLLWRSQVAGNLKAPIVGADHLKPLLAEPEDVEIPGAGTGGSGVPDDLHLDEIREMERSF